MESSLLTNENHKNTASIVDKFNSTTIALKSMRDTSDDTSECETTIQTDVQQSAKNSTGKFLPLCQVTGTE